MRDVGFFENIALRRISVLKVKTFGMELRVQNGLIETAGVRRVVEPVEDFSSDSFAATLAQNGHPANLGLAISHDKPPAPNRHIAVERENVHCMRVIGIPLDRFGDALFLDEDAAADPPCLRHLVRSDDLHQGDRVGARHET